MSVNSEKYPPVVISLFLIIVVLFTVTYGKTLESYYHYLSKNEYYFERVFTLTIALIYMLWERRDLFLTTVRKPNILWGAPLLFMSSLLLVAGQTSNIQALREMSFATSIIAMVTLLLGTDFTRRFFLPLIFLFFMMTVMINTITSFIVAPLQLLSTIATEEMLRFFGCLVYREGTYLHLPYIVLEVAGECSGFNQLVITVALGIATAFIMLDDFGKRMAILIWSSLIGILVNWLRIFFISLWHYSSAKESIHGPYDLFNRLPYLIGLFFILLLAVKLTSKEKNSEQGNQSSVATSTHSSTHLENITQASFTAILILSICSFYLYL